MSKTFHILILGAETAIGQAVVEQSQSIGIPLYAVNSEDWDLASSASINGHLAELKPSCVISCISPESKLLTARTAKLMASACDGQHIFYMQLSSNCAFAKQEGEVFLEEDQPKPKSVYGKKVVAIENAIQSLCPRHIILRVGWLFSSSGEDDVYRLLDLAKEESVLTLSDNRAMCPTSVCDVASVMLAVIQQARFVDLWGIYHYASSEQTTLFKFAEVVIAEARQLEELAVKDIIADPSSDMNRLFSESQPKIVNKKILYTFGIKPKPWRQSLSRVLKNRYQRIEIEKTR